MLPLGPEIEKRIEQLFAPEDREEVRGLLVNECGENIPMWKSAGLERLRRKSIALTGWLQRLVEARLSGLVDIITPSEAQARGCQLSLRIARPADVARRCHDELTAAGIVGDWREPDVLRLAPTPLYNSFGDVLAAVDALSQAVRR